MFFITGESYDWGSGAAFDGTILASVGRVIVVTLNYRLGLFGKYALLQLQLFLLLTFSTCDTCQ